MAGEKILVIDPNTDRLNKMGDQILTPYGYKSFLTDNLDEGVKLIITRSPQLLLLHLPLDSAAQFLQRVAHAGHFVPSILMIEGTAKKVWGRANFSLTQVPADSIDSASVARCFGARRSPEKRLKKVGDTLLPVGYKRRSLPGNRQDRKKKNAGG